MKQPTTKSLAQQLVEVRAKLNELEETYNGLKVPLERQRDELSHLLIEDMRKTEVLSTRYEDFSIVRKTSSKAVIMDPFSAVQFLKQNNPKYVIEAVHPEALKEVSKGTLEIQGVLREQREYISISQKKPNAPASGAETIQ